MGKTGLAMTLAFSAGRHYGANDAKSAAIE